ncbi:MAG: chorismate synthase [Clostridia bacterium]|nr:chorismate synthase [Clostridia bacterium]
MATFNGKKLKIEIEGTSHSEELLGKVYSFLKFKFNEDELNDFMKRRQGGQDAFSTPRKEEDRAIFSGVKNGEINGDFSFVIKNNNVKSKDYNNLYGKPRPSHADYASYLKDGTLDFSGGGRFSGRLTAPVCVIGGICKQYLKTLGIEIEAFVSQVGCVYAKSYKDGEILLHEIKEKRGGVFPSLDKKQEILDEIERARKDGDSVGGKIECIVFNPKTALGDNLFSGLEGKIASLIYSVPAVKGVEFGLGFDFCKGKGSNANDQMEYKDGKVEFLSNNSGGINGGITNGAPITIGVAIRPTPSIKKEQKTVDLIKKENTTIKIEGRHDSCIVKRAVPVIESVVAIAITDEIL